MLHTTRRLDPLVPPPVKAEVERNTAFLEHGLIDDKHRLLEGNALVVRALTGVTALAPGETAEALRKNEGWTEEQTELPHV